MKLLPCLVDRWADDSLTRKIAKVSLLSPGQENSVNKKVYSIAIASAVSDINDRCNRKQNEEELLSGSFAEVNDQS